MKRELGTVTKVVSDLWTAHKLGEPLPPAAVALRRYWLYLAISQELEWRMVHVCSIYDPDRDMRVTWARQFLEVREGLRPKVDPDIEACAAALIDPTPLPLSGKDLAAGMQFQPLT